MANENQVQISKKTLTEQVESGMKKKELASHYSISELAMGRILKEAGLQIRKFHINRPVLVDDTLAPAETTIVDNTQDAAVEALEEQRNAEANTADENLNTTANQAPQDQNVEWKS